MSEVPPYATPNQPAFHSHTSGKAIASLILGLLFCIPVIPSLLALFFSISGFRATRIPGVRGRGFAITGLVLGICGTLFWAGMSGFISFLIVGSKAPRATLLEFQTQLAANNLPEALKVCDPVVAPADLVTLQKVVAPLGTFVNQSCTSVYLQPSTCTLSGYAHFSGGSHPFSAILMDRGGVWKIYRYEIY